MAEYHILFGLDTDVVEAPLDGTFADLHAAACARFAVRPAATRLTFDGTPVDAAEPLHAAPHGAPGTQLSLVHQTDLTAFYAWADSSEAGAWHLARHLRSPPEQPETRETYVRVRHVCETASNLALHRLCEALSSGLCPPHTTVSLEGSCRRGAEVAGAAVAAMLASGGAPPTLSLTLSRGCLRDGGAAALALGVADAARPRDLTLRLEENMIGPDGVRALLKAAEVEDAAAAAGAGGRDDGRRLSLFLGRLKGECVAVVAEALRGGRLPENLTLGVGLQQTAACHGRAGTEGAEALADALASGRCPKRLSLRLLQVALADADAAVAFAGAFSPLRVGGDGVGGTPEGLELSFANGSVGDEGAEALAMALRAGACPKDLSLDLRNCRVGEVGARALAGALSSGKCPEGLRLSVAANDLGESGVRAMAFALRSGKCPKRLDLNLGGTKGGPGGQDGLCAALRSGKCPEGLKLDRESQGLFRRRNEGRNEGGGGGGGGGGARCVCS